MVILAFLWKNMENIPSFMEIYGKIKKNFKSVNNYFAFYLEKF